MMLSGILGQGLFGDFELGGHGLLPPPIPSSFTSLLSQGAVVTCTVQSIWGSQNQQNILTLFSQDYLGNAVEIPGVITLVFRLPDHSLLTLSSSSIPPIVHVNGTGTYQSVIAMVESGIYPYTWYANNQPIWSGEIHAIQKAVP